MAKKAKIIRGRDHVLGNKLRKLILFALREHICEVRILKKDGSKRTLSCTLVPEFLPPLKGSKKDAQDPPRERDPLIIPVWDLEAMAWRSFSMERFLRLIAH